MKSKKKVAPVVLVYKDGRMIVADGYHRICAALAVQNEAEVPAIRIQM